MMRPQVRRTAVRGRSSSQRRTLPGSSRTTCGSLMPSLSCVLHRETPRKPMGSATGRMRWPLTDPCVSAVPHRTACAAVGGRRRGCLHLMLAPAPHGTLETIVEVRYCRSMIALLTICKRERARRRGRREVVAAVPAREPGLARQCGRSIQREARAGCGASLQAVPRRRRPYARLTPAVPGQSSCPMDLHDSRLLSSEASLAPQDGLCRLHTGNALEVVKQAQPLLEP